MTCQKCGAKIKKTSKFCPECGAAQQILPKPAKGDAKNDAKNISVPKVVAVVDVPKGGQSAKKTKKQNKKAIVIICLIILAVLFLAPFVYILTNPALEVNRALSSGNFTEAAEIFGTKIKDGTITQRAAQAAVKGYIDTQCASFAAGGEDFDTASGNIRSVAGMNVVDASLTTAALSYVQRINVSRDAWTNAEAAFKAGDYVTAITQYGQVIDENYSTAQERIEEAKAAYREQVLDEANKLVDAQNYTEAAALINGALAVLPEDGRLEQRLTFIEDGASAEALAGILESAKTLAASDDYEGAITTMNDAQAAYGGDPSYLEAISEIQASYREYTLQQAQRTSEIRGFAAAADLIDETLSVMPNDEELIKARDNYRAAAASSPAHSSSSSASSTQQQ